MKAAASCRHLPLEMFAVKSPEIAAPTRRAAAAAGALRAPLPHAADFAPPRWVRNPHLQTILGAGGLRRFALARHARALERHTRAEILELDDDVRLQGFHTPQHALAERLGLVLLLHGWEGHARSDYVVAVAAGLVRAGYDVFRLNFRDHGDSHGLNAEPFHSCRLQEVVGAAARIFARPGGGLHAVAGFSLGGNFALRLANAAPARGISLDYALAVSPVIDPAAGLRRLERARLYHAYFMRKWRASLRRKRSLFPKSGVISPRELRLPMRELTRALVMRYTDFGSLEAYLDGYSVAGGRLAGLQVPTTILAAADDPVIPVADFGDLRLPACVELDIALHGGHCAFLSGRRPHSFVLEYLLARLHALAAQSIADRATSADELRAGEGPSLPQKSAMSVRGV